MRRREREKRHTPNNRRKSSEAAKKAWGEMGGRERWAKDEVDCIVGASCLKEHTYGCANDDEAGSRVGAETQSRWVVFLVGWGWMSDRDDKAKSDYSFSFHEPLTPTPPGLLC